MKFHKLTFFAGIFLTLVMFMTAFMFDYFHSENSFFNQNFIIYAMIALVAMLIINYLVLDLLLNFYGKKQIRKMSDFFPEDLENVNEPLNIELLGEKITSLTEKNATEVGLLKDMEMYRTEYVGNVSHELKTPLFSIQGYVETLIEGGVEDITIRDKYLERIDKSVERLISIVEDLDMISQYEYGHISINYSQFNLNTLISEIIDLLDLESQRKNAKISLKNSPIVIMVNADKQKISQVLINLISNALHYSNREQAQITVTTSALKSKVLVEVKDNGMGIKPELLPRIFERFYRVENSRNRKDGGSGLGLAIVKHILEAHNQKIQVESQYLEGATFSFLLDRA